MKFSGQLQSVEAIFAFGRVYNCVVLVHFGGERPIAYLPPQVDRPEDLCAVHLQCMSGIHYNPAYVTS